MKCLEIWNCNSLWNFHTVFSVCVTISSSVQKTQKEKYWLPSEICCCLNISIWKGCLKKTKTKTNTSVAAVKHVMKHILYNIILHRWGYFGWLELDYLHVSDTYKSQKLILMNLKNDLKSISLLWRKNGKLVFSFIIKKKKKKEEKALKHFIPCLQLERLR